MCVWQWVWVYFGGNQVGDVCYVYEQVCIDLVGDGVEVCLVYYL